MKSLYILISIVVCMSMIHSCIEPKQPYSSLAPGIWRGILYLGNDPKLPLKEEIERYEKEKTRPIQDIESELPFLFEVKYENEKPFIEIINGEEHIRLDDIRVGRNKSTAEDTVHIDFPVFDSHIHAVLKEGILQGEFTVRSKTNYHVPFAARFGKNKRFDLIESTPTINLSGNWQCMFDLDTESPYPAVGEFKQDGNTLTGTFRTETGDYRYLDGLVSGNKFYLSCFDGAHLFLFTGKVEKDSLIASFKSGKSKPSPFGCFRDEKASIKEATTLNKESGKPVAFTFLNQNGEIKSLKDYTKDIKIVQIMGTWCPNCWDETKFISNYVKAHPDKSIDVIPLSCERYRDTVKALGSIKNYKYNMKLPYDLLLASLSTSKVETSKQLPFIDTILAYPTMIVLNKSNQIEFIHTGFDGPATSKHQEFVKDFDSRINAIIKKQTIQ